MAAKRSEINEGLGRVSHAAGELGWVDLPESGVILPSYLRDYEFVVVENLIASNFVNKRIKVV